MIDSPRLDFSFSGLKTALLYEISGSSHGRLQPGALEPGALDPARVADLAASYQEAIVDVLVAKCRKAVRRTGRPRLLVGGGVAANRRLRERLAEMAAAESLELVLAPPNLCTDNAAMAALAWEHFDRGRSRRSISTSARPPFGTADSPYTPIAIAASVRRCCRRR